MNKKKEGKMLIAIHDTLWFRKVVMLLIGGVIFLTTPASAQVFDRARPFQPGQALEVTIWQEPDLSGEYSIDSQGYVILPLIGRVKVSDFSKESLESFLVNEYSSYLRSPIIMVEPLMRVGVVGQVSQPGLYRVNPDAPLWDVLVESGGFARRANLKGIKVMRGGNVVRTDLLNDLEVGKSAATIGLQSGDLIMVPESRRVMEWRTIIAFVSLGVTTTFLVINSLD